MQTLQKCRVMIVEDQPRLRQMLQRAVEEMELRCEAVGSAEEAMRQLEQDVPCVLLLDLNLPGMSGLDFFEQARRRWPHIQGIVLTGYGDLDAAKRAIHLDICEFLTKPCSLADLEQALDRSVRRARAAKLAAASPPALFGGAVDEGEPEVLKLNEVEREHILQTLERNQGNREKTAVELGISLRVLYYRLAEYRDQGYPVV